MPKRVASIALRGSATLHSRMIESGSMPLNLRRLELDLWSSTGRVPAYQWLFNELLLPVCQALFVTARERQVSLWAVVVFWTPNPWPFVSAGGLRRPGLLGDACRPCLGRKRSWRCSLAAVFIAAARSYGSNLPSTPSITEFEPTWAAL